MTRRSLSRGILVALAVLAGSATAAAAQQATIVGRVMDAAGAPLANAQVLATHQVTGAERGTYTDDDGRYMIGGLNPRGPYRIEAKQIGYGTDYVEVAGLDAAATTEFTFELGREAVSLDAIEVFAERARDQQTPVAYSQVDEVQIQRQLASRDLPLVLNTKPSVYATEGGGGAGDARINVRGFSQRNVAVMINGVPVNDMENGWVYWSNWDGVGDFTKSIQLQRGMSAVNLATPSIGGSLNLITDPTTLGADVMLKQEFGNDGFMKSTGLLSTGLLNDRFAFMVAGARRRGDGVVPGAWMDTWSYYAAASWILNDANRLDLYATGAPQRHGQRLYAQNIAAFDPEYAAQLDGFEQGAIDRYGVDPVAGTGDGLLYNQNVAPVSCDYDGLQAVGDDTFERFDCNFLNERENFYHKPQVNLNWYSHLTDALQLSTVAYYSGGRGGGTGTLGSVEWNYSGPSRVPDWNATIAINEGALDGDGSPKTPGESLGILRNSRNNQQTIGAISRLKYDVGSDLQLELGFDGRIAEIEHYREVRDLLGGDFFLKTGDAFSPNQQVGLGEKIDYYNTNEVRWFGGHLQGQYFTGRTSAYGMVGLAGVKYEFTDHFRMDDDGDELVLKAHWQPAFQVKGGGLYNLSDELGVFANAGYVEQMPIFDQVINDVSAEFVENPENQKFISAELGARYQSLDMPIEVNGNVYFTQWLDRVTTERFEDASGASTEDVFITLTGLQQRHAGVELEANYQPLDLLRLDVAGSFNSWEYTDDVTGSYRPEGGDVTFDYDIFVDGLKVGNAPQVQFSYAAMLFPIDGAYVQLVGKTFMEHYADFNPFDRTDPDDLTQPWQVPDYSVFDLHVGYNLPPSLVRSLDVRVFGNVFNVFDETYVMDALDNSPFNSFDQDHDADDAEVFFGLPRRFTIGASVTY